MAEYNIARHGLPDAFGPRFILSQVTVSLEEVLLVTPHWVEKTAPDVAIPLCPWGQLRLADAQCVPRPLLDAGGVRKGELKSLSLERTDYE